MSVHCRRRAPGMPEFVRPEIRRTRLLEGVASLPPCHIGWTADPGRITGHASSRGWGSRRAACTVHETRTEFIAPAYRPFRG